jgi:hypothetical protein
MEAEGLYHQLMAVSLQLPDNVRAVLELKPITKSLETNNQDNEVLNKSITNSNEENTFLINNVGEG